MCVQIDVDKPLITTILIGKLQQLVSYEGIQRLCFGCGRVGHRREGCPYTIHRGPSQDSSGMEETADRSGKACDLHEADTTRTEAGFSISMQEDTNGNVQEDLYRPWVVVTRKRNGTKAQRSGGPSVVHDN